MNKFLNDDLMAYGWWNNVPTSTDLCEVYRVNEPTYLGKREIIHFAEMFKAKHGSSGGKIHIYWPGWSGKMEGISGSWLWTSRCEGDESEWKMRITDDERDILIIVKNKEFREGMNE